MTAGRPSDYTPELAARICSLMAEGNSLVKITDIEGMPCKTTVYSWISQHPEFRAIYEKAQQDRADAFAEEINDIADKATPETVQVARLQVDVRKWNAARMKPKKYGDSTLLKHGDPDGNAMPLTTILTSIDGRTSGLPGNKKET